MVQQVVLAFTVSALQFPRPVRPSLRMNASRRSAPKEWHRSVLRGVPDAGARVSPATPHYFFDRLRAARSQERGIPIGKSTPIVVRRRSGPVTLLCPPRPTGDELLLLPRVQRALGTMQHRIGQREMRGNLWVNSAAWHCFAAHDLSSAHDATQRTEYRDPPPFTLHLSLHSERNLWIHACYENPACRHLTTGMAFFSL